jgi:SAM-dependent methyltransferase
MHRDRWEDASAYDRFMGRWSRALGREVVGALAIRPGASWLEIGCGTGSLTSAICDLAAPASVVACDTAADYVAYCRERLRDPRLEVVEAGTGELPVRPGGFDAVVSSLVLNFLPRPVEALGRMRDACAPGGCVAACVWDYAEGMEFLRRFWDAAVALDPAAAPLDEGQRFPICRPEALRAAFESAGLRSVAVEPITVATEFESFGDYWEPFVDGPGPAPTYVATLSPTARERLESRLARALAGPERLRLRARAWLAWGLRDSG